MTIDKPSSIRIGISMICLYVASMLKHVVAIASGSLICISAQIPTKIAGIPQDINANILSGLHFELELADIINGRDWSNIKYNPSQHIQAFVQIMT